jgi:hypothetical protein
MTRMKSLLIAIAVTAISATAVLGYAALPTASGPGLDKATEASGRTVPARPAQDAQTTTTQSELTTDAAADLPEAAAHGDAVSTVAAGDDTTPDTNHGADVSAVARDNHGQEIAATHKPADAGKPEGAGQPDDPGQPTDPGPPTGAGRP